MAAYTNELKTAINQEKDRTTLDKNNIITKDHVDNIGTPAVNLQKQGDKLQTKLSIVIAL